MKRIIFIILSFSTLLLSGQSLIEVPKDAANLSAAVQLSQPGDTILLQPGIYTDSVHISNTNLIFRGDPNGGSILSPGANGKSFVVSNATVEFENLIFDDFEQNTPFPNGAIFADYSDIKINQCQFLDMGTAVSILWGNLEFSNSVVKNSRGVGILQNGGEFLVYNSLLYGLDKTVFSTNRAHGYFFNNTIIGSTPNRNRAVVINSDSISHFFNNIIQGFGIAIQLLASDSTELQALRIYNNNVFANLRPYSYEYNESLSLPIFSGALVPNPGTGELRVWSDFQDTTNFDFSLKYSSPCTDAGSNNYPFPVSVDLDSKPRLIGQAPDIGALENQGSLSYPSKEGVEVLRVFPNPNKGAFTLILPMTIKGEVEVLNTAGKHIKSINVNGQSEVFCDLVLKPGLYYLRWSGENTSGVHKVLIK